MTTDNEKARIFMLEIKINHEIAYVVLNHNLYNTLSHEILVSLPKELQQLDKNQNIKVIIIKSSSREYFSTGLDIEDLKKDTISLFEKLLLCIKEVYILPTPILVELKGHAIAGGAVLSALADYRFATPNVKVVFNEIQLGISIPNFLISILENIVKPNDVKQILFLGRPMLSKHLLEFGFIDKIYEKNKISNEIENLAKKIAKLDKKTLQKSKYNLRKDVAQKVSQNIDYILNNFSNFINLEIFHKKINEITSHK